MTMPGRWLCCRYGTRQGLPIPPGFAHGFCVTSESAEFLYKTTDYWSPAHERTLLWSDAQLAIPWPLTGEPLLATKDIAGKPLSAAETFA